MSVPVRPGYCSVCGVKSISDPCALCSVETGRRIVNEREARAKRDAEALIGAPAVGSDVERRRT